MACDFSALASIDSEDPEDVLRLLNECTRVLTDPKLWMWAIALTVICGAVGAYIGRRRNTVVRDAIFGAALGPIGWIISWYLPAPKQQPACPACKRNVDVGDAHCRHCGAKLARR